jgi:hypothetical protein
MKVSWCFFGATILLGLVFHITDILRVFHHARSELIIGDGITLEEDPIQEQIRKLNDQTTAIYTAELSYLFLVVQTIIFFIAIFLLTIFIISVF